MKNKFKNHLYYNWYFYVLIALVVCIIDWFAIRNITAFKVTEKVSIFIASYDCETKKIEEVAFKDADKSLKQVNVLHYQPNDKNIGTIVQSVGVIRTDIVILPKELTSNDFVYRYFAPIYNFKDNLSKLGSFNYVKYAEKDMGIDTYNKEKGINLFKDLITYNPDASDYQYDEFVMFINASSPNFASLIENGSTDNATNVLKNLIEYGKK